MKESIYKSYDELPLFLNAATVAKVLGVAPSSAYVVVAKSAQLRFRLSAKTALASLLLLSPQNRYRLCGGPIGVPCPENRQQDGSLQRSVHPLGRAEHGGR